MATVDTCRLSPLSAGASGVSGGAERAGGMLVGGLVMTEIVTIERSGSGSWEAASGQLPATFEELRLDERVAMEAWTHKPLMRVWLLPDTDLRDGDRIVRCDGSCWYVRGAPLAAPGRTHLAALTEAAAEDGLFAARSSAGPP